MRWLSNLIKSGNVVLKKPMSLETLCSIVIHPHSVRKPAAVKRGQRSNDIPNTAEEPGSSEDILKLVSFKSKEIYEQSRKQGVAEGFARGLEQGACDGEEQIQAAENAAAAVIGQLKTESEKEYRKTQAEVESEVLDFAFAVASKILNMPIDRDDPRFLNLFDGIDQTGAPDDDTDSMERSVQTIVSSQAGEADSEMNIHTAGKITIAAAALPEDEEPYPGLADLMRLEENDRQRLLNSVDIRDLVVAFRGADEKVTQAVLGSFPERMRDTLREEINLSGSVLLSDVEKSRLRIGRVMRQMQETGEIKNGKEKEDDVYV